ncbi:MAG: quinol:electron acceptor oxidoreductase subunit ActD [Planctomycetota bacterium]
MDCNAGDPTCVQQDTATAPPTLGYRKPDVHTIAAPPPDAPVAPKDRLVSIDALRGVAILGILLLNIRSFALPGMGYMIPTVTETDGKDLAVFIGINVVGWGKFMSTFAMLYGVGILLSTRRFEHTGGAASVFFRRSGILAFIGLLHAFLLWYGDILFAYAIIGMLAFNGLPRHHHPLFNSERFLSTSDDAFFISVEAKDSNFDPDATRKLLEEAGATHIELVEE